MLTTLDITVATATLSESPWRFQAHPEVWLLTLFVVGVVVVRAAFHWPLYTRGTWWGTIGDAAASVADGGVGDDAVVKQVTGQSMTSARNICIRCTCSNTWHCRTSCHPLLCWPLPCGCFVQSSVRSVPGGCIRWFAQPVIAGVLFNVVVMVTHIPAMVNQSVSNPVLHYSLHVSLVVTSLLMWIPIVAPDPSMRIGYGGRMVYLFLMSVIPTVPAAWLTFARRCGL